MNKCAYCHSEVRVPYPVTVGKDKDCLTCCGEGCAEKARSYYNYFERTKVIYFIGLAISAALLLASVILLSIKHMWSGSIFMGASLTILGIVVIFFPFASPQTYDLFGVKNTQRLTRIFGVVIIALGLFLAYFVRT